MPFPLAPQTGTTPENIFLKFLTDERPHDAQTGDHISLHMISTRSNEADVIEVDVDHRERHPSSLELQGYTLYHNRRYRATIVCNDSTNVYDSATLVYHP